MNRIIAKLLISCIFLAGILVFTSSAVAGDDCDRYKIKRQKKYEKWVGVKAPPFGYSTKNCFDNNTINLEKFRGKKVLLVSFYSGDFVNAADEKKLKKQLQLIKQIQQKIGHENLAVIGFTKGIPMYLQLSKSTSLKNIYNDKEIQSLITFPVVNSDTQYYENPYSFLCNGGGFLIDRNGIIISVHSYPLEKKTFMDIASIKDWNGSLNKMPVNNRSKISLIPIKSIKRLWSKPIPSIIGMCSGDWDLDGESDLLCVSKDKQKLIVIDKHGDIKDEVLLPDLNYRLPVTIEWAEIEKGKSAVMYYTGGWDSTIPVVSSDGKTLWTYKGSPVNDATFLDVNNDGYVELLVGSSKGLDVFSYKGNRIKQKTDLGAVEHISGIPRLNNQNGNTALYLDFFNETKLYKAASLELINSFKKNFYTHNFHGSMINPEADIQAMLIIDKYGTEEGFASVHYRNGDLVWEIPINTDAMKRTRKSIMAEDVTNDKIKEWLVYTNYEELHVLNSKGQLISKLNNPVKGWSSWGVLPRKGLPNLIIAAGSEELVAYSLVQQLEEDVLIAKGDYETDRLKAGQFYEQALKIIEAKKQDNWELVNLFSKLSSYYLKTGNYNRAHAILKRELQLRQSSGTEPNLIISQYSVFGKSDLQAANAKLADVYSHIGKYDEAEKLYIKKLNNLKTSDQPNEYEILGTMEKLVTIYRSQAEYAKGSQTCKEMLIKSKKIYGKNNIRTGFLYTMLLDFLLKQKKYKEAKKYLHQAVEISKICNAPDKKILAVIIVFKRAKLLILQKKLSEAKEVLEKLVLIVENNLGPNHPYYNQAQSSIKNMQNSLK